MISNSQEILQSITLDTIIGEYVELKRRGSNLMGNCPFHDENTGSFSVTPTKGIYKCFGCGKGGNNAAQFLMDLQKITYPEALEAIAHKSNIRLEYDSSDKYEEYKKISKEKREKRQAQEPVMQAAYDLYFSKSKSPADDIKDGEFIDIAGKKYTIETWKKWKLILRDKENIIKNSDLDQDTLLDLGLLNRNEAGQIYDFFYNRLLFPIHSPSGHIEGITARALDDSKPKYLNSKDSELYNKNKALFGIFFNRKNIEEKQFAYLVEGTTDVILLDQNGINNAVATCGTSLSIDHAQVLRRYTSQVSIIRDADNAGYKATIHDIDVLTQAQIRCNVIFLPKGEDPASFISASGKDKWIDYVDDAKNSHEGIKWRVGQEIRDKKNEHQKEVALRVAAKLLTYIDSDILREEFIKSLSKDTIGCTTRILTDAYEEEYTKGLDKGPKLTPDQTRDKDLYGIYPFRQNYLNAAGTHISNFILKPIFLVRSGQKSYRVFDLFNEAQQSKCVVLESDDLIQLNTFRKKTEMYGNYVFYSNENDYIRLRRLLYEKMTTVYQLNSLGYVKSTGIYAWGNGITTPDGEFIEVDEYGRVSYNDYSYYLQAFSKLNKDELQQEDDPNDFEKKFIYGRTDMTIQEWAFKWYEIFGENAIIGLAFYFSCIMRDHIQAKFNCFPILNLFGPAGSGKSTMSRCIGFMFGKEINPIHCVNATKAAFLRRVAQCYNAVSVYEEYSDLVPDERAQAIKSFYDGDGRSMAKRETSNKTESYPVNSGVILVGQMLPDHDPALIERCVTVFFKEVLSNKTKDDILNTYMKLGKEGKYSFITSIINSKRKEIIEEFDQLFEATRSKIEAKLTGISIKQRVLNSYSILATIYFATVIKLELPSQETESILSIFATKVAEQSEVNAKATELNEFWDIVDFLLQRKELTKEFYQVFEDEYVTTIDKSGKSEKIALGSKKTILSYNLNYVYALYVKECGIRRVNRVLKKATLIYYLSIQKYTIGQSPGMRFNPHLFKDQKTSRAWLFDLDMLNESQPINADVTKGHGDNAYFE